MSDRGMRAAAAAHRAGNMFAGMRAGHVTTATGRTVLTSPARTLEEIIHQHLHFGKVRSDFIRTAFLALAACGEAGELANDVKKKWRGDRKYKGKAGHAAWLKKIKSEVVDLGNYVYMLADHLDLDLRKEMVEKLLEVEERDDDWNVRNCRCSTKKLTLGDVVEHMMTNPKTARRVGKSKFLAVPKKRRPRQRKTPSMRAHLGPGET